MPVGGTRHRTKRPRGQVVQPPRTTPSPFQLLTGTRGRTVANVIAASGPSDRTDRAAGPFPPVVMVAGLAAGCWLLAD